MKPPVETVRVSTRGKEILIKTKRHTGLQHWNELCRVALCRSLANPTLPPKPEKASENAIEIEWKTFAGPYQQELTALTLLRAEKDGVDTTNKDLISEYFKAHIERGILSLQNVKTINSLY